MKTLLLALVLASNPAPQERVSSLTGNIKKHEAFPSKFLKTPHNITVYLPPGYEKDARVRYPVFYMGDGQNLFDGKTSFLPNKEWRVDETAQALIEAELIEPIIVVGIDNGGVERANEYLPTRRNFRGTDMGGQGDDWVRMLVEEIKPMTDKTYRTKAGARNTAVGGSSFGGIIALHTALSRPDLFGKAAIVSPALFWDDRVMIKRVEGLAKKPNVKIWLDMGTAEGAEMNADVGKLFEALKAKGWKPGRDLAYMVEPGAMHNEDAWARRMGEILLFLFGK